MSETSSPAGTRLELCAIDDVAPGSALRVEAGDLTLAVFNVDGTFYVTDDQCTHGPGSLSEGFLDECIIECDFHQGQFDVRTGEPVLAPCTIPVRTYPVMLENEKVYITV